MKKVEVARKKNWGKCVFAGACATVMVLMAVAAVLNRQWIYDWWRGMNYEPSMEMVSIRDGLGLTGRGEFLFKAARPSLSTR